jgi:thiol-disulfide isomerase/thioredoxin
MRPTVAIMMSLAGMACTPNLTSPAGADYGADSWLDWEPPENSWPTVDTLPSDITSQGWAEGQIPPDVRMIDQNGDEVSLWQFHGLVIAVDISTMWCSPCQKIADEVKDVQADYEDDGFIYLSVLPQNSGGATPNVEDLNTWSDMHDISTPILADADGISYDVVPDQIWPRILVIGRDLRVDNEQVQPAEDIGIRSAIEAAL